MGIREKVKSYLGSSEVKTAFAAGNTSDLAGSMGQNLSPDEAHLLFAPPTPNSSHNNIESNKLRIQSMLAGSAYLRRIYPDIIPLDPFKFTLLKPDKPAIIDFTTPQN